MGKIAKHYNLSILKPIIRPKCYQDESPIGYLIRLAEVNGYNTYKWLVTIEELIIYSGTPSHVEAYNLLKKIAWTGFNEANEVNKICNNSADNLNLNNVHYCSLCLRENNYFRMNLQMKTAFTCLKHKVWLKDFCPSCNEPIKYSTSLLGKCSCGMVLANQPVEDIPESVYLLQQYLFDINLVSRSSAYQITDVYLKLTITERTDYFLFMLRWLPKAILERRKSNTYANTIKQLRENITTLAKLFMQGTSRFWELIEQLNELDKQYRLENKLEKLVFNKFYQYFYKKFPNNNFLIFRKLIEKYIKKFWKKQLTYRNILFNSDLIKSHPWIPINQAIKEFKLTTAEVQRAIKDKSIIALIAQKENRKFTLLFRPSIRLRLEEIKDRISFKQTTQVLGITKKQLNQLIVEKYFSKAIPPKKDYSLEWLFSSQEISQFLKELFKIATDIQEETVLIAEAMRIIGSKIDNPLPKLLKKIKDQEIAVTIGNYYRNIKALAISKRELNNWIQEASGNGNKYFTIPQLAKLLNTNQQLAYQLVNNELIDCFVDKKSRKRLITEESLSSFNVKYIFLSQLSKVIKIGSRTLMHYFAYKRVFPIDHFWKDKFRQKIYYKKELRNISLVSTLTMIKNDCYKPVSK